jgi:DNA-binding NtrC family response regulator
MRWRGFDTDVLPRKEKGDDMDVMDLVRMPGTLPQDPGRNRVLVVDDELTHRMMMARMLRKAGYQCGTAMSTSEARYALSNDTFGLLVTDIRMWAEDGLELVRYVDDEYPDTFSIVVTGFADVQLEEVARRSGAYKLLQKPFNSDEFTQAVGEAFEKRDAEVALRRHQSA